MLPNKTQKIDTDRFALCKIKLIALYLLKRLVKTFFNKFIFEDRLPHLLL